MSDQQGNEPIDPKVAADRKLLLDAQQKGTGAKLGTYVRLSGPGWLQSAITLGGGSLAGSLYVGVIGGYEMMWLQPLMMIFGIIMLSAIAYVTLSTGMKPFQAINQHVNPVLGWGWLIAATMANLVWAIPQFALGTAALRQNLFPSLLGEGGTMGADGGLYFSIALLFILGSIVIWFYDSGGWGVKVFEIILKVMVAIVVLSFFGVVIAMSTSKTGLPWSDILAGFVPNFNLLSEPASQIQEVISQSAHKEYWHETVVQTQRERMIAAAATAVGINMTFLLPYSMIRKGWDRTFRGMATFDLSTGLFIPFLLATSCVVIAAATQFHGQFDEGLFDPAKATPNTEKVRGAYEGNLNQLLMHQIGPDFKSLSADEIKAKQTSTDLVDKQISAMLVKRDAWALAGSLENLTGKGTSGYIFGIGVLGMAISTIIILMLINGFTTCEMLNAPISSNAHRIGSILPGITGAVGFLIMGWGAEAQFWLAVPTSIFGMILLPIAYITFFFMMNNKSLLGNDIPKGGKRIAINIAMILAIIAASIGAGWSIWTHKYANFGLGLLGAFIALTVIVHFVRPPKKA